MIVLEDGSISAIGSSLEKQLGITTALCIENKIKIQTLCPQLFEVYYYNKSLNEVIGKRSLEFCISKSIYKLSSLDFSKLKEELEAQWSKIEKKVTINFEIEDIKYGVHNEICFKLFKS